MEDLPNELISEIASHMSHVDILSMSRTCRVFAAIVRPFLFETLRFHCEPVGSVQHKLSRHPSDRNHPGRAKVVEEATLESAVAEVIELGIARYATTFQYSPKYYHSAFWVEDRGDINHEREPGNTDHEPSTDELRRMLEARESRLDNERQVIANATKCWRHQVRQQIRNAHTVDAALVRLFSDMPKLNRIDLFEWLCEPLLRGVGTEQELNADVQAQLAGYRVTQRLEQISRALQATNTRIEHLLLPSIIPNRFPEVDTIQHMFSNLRSLSFNLFDTSCMAVGKERSLSPLGQLIRSARHTLEKLEFSNFFALPPFSPGKREHLLEYLWGYESDSGRDPIIFPRLKVLNLTNLLIYAPSLITFLQTQSTLQNVAFEHVFVGTKGYSWATVVAALPPACTKLHIACSRGPSISPRVWPVPAPRSNISHTDLKTFRPYSNPIPGSTGWRTSVSLFKQQVEESLSKLLEIGDNEDGRELKRHIHDVIAKLDWSMPFVGPMGASPFPLAIDLTGIDAQFRAPVQSWLGTFALLHSADYERI